MSFAEIIETMQSSIIDMQQKLEELKKLDISTAHEVYLTKQEAADLIKKSIRQLDRDCDRYGIPKVHVNGGIRIRKSDLLRHMGLLPKEEESADEDEFTRIYKRHWG